MRQKRDNKQTTGFTLVELSIVLVIIGLLIGGILAAQSMIKTAKIMQQIRQIEQIQIMVTNFKTKYSSLPGDSKFFSTAGDGNGQIALYKSYPNTINGNESAATYAYYGRAEWFSVFEHLSLAGMYNFPTYDDTVTASNAAGIGYPRMVLQSNASDSLGFKGGIIVGWEAGFASIKEGHKIHLGTCAGDNSAPAASSAEVSFFCGPTPVDAQAIDSKLDDGKPYSGNVSITSTNYIYRVPTSSIGDETSNCGNSASNSYRITRTNSCAVEIYEDF